MSRFTEASKQIEKMYQVPSLAAFAGLGEVDRMNPDAYWASPYQYNGLHGDGEHVLAGATSGVGGVLVGMAAMYLLLKYKVVNL